MIAYNYYDYSIVSVQLANQSKACGYVDEYFVLDHSIHSDSIVM